MISKKKKIKEKTSSSHRDATEFTALFRTSAHVIDCTIDLLDKYRDNVAQWLPQSNKASHHKQQQRGSEVGEMTNP